MNRRTLHIVAIAAAGVVAAGAIAVPAAMAEAPGIEHGRLIAEKRCSMCHAVGASGDSPQSIVLPFRRMQDRFPIEMLREALTTGVVSGHEEMPMFDLGQDDTRALIGYIDSLAAKDRRYLADPRKP